MPFQQFRGLSFCLPVILLVACGGGGGGGSQPEPAQLAAENGAEPAPRLSALCGVYEEERIVAAPSGDLEQVSVEVLSSDAAIVTRLAGDLAGQRQLVKFHGITSDGVESLRILNGIDVLQRELAGGALFAEAGCPVVFPGGGEGVLGQLFSLAGESMSERMLMEAAAVPSAGDTCEGAALAQCYQTIGVTPREPTAIELQVQDADLSSRCGVVQDGVLQSTIPQAELVRVEPATTELVQITRLLGLEAGVPELVKLQGLSSLGISETRLRLGADFIINASSGGAFMVLESRECLTAASEGSTVRTVQLFSTAGESINEQLLANGYAAAAADACGGEALLDCYQQVAAEAPPEPPPLPPPPPAGEHQEEEGGNYVEGIIRDFLWKPVSESNGNVAVLVNPTNVRVVVRGAIQETLRNQGPSNGRGTTARGSAPGCAYGHNIVLEFFDSSGQLIPIIGGGSSITIADGCDRVEFRR